MHMMKKLFAGLVVICCFGLAACGNDEQQEGAVSPDPVDTLSPQVEPQPPQSPMREEPPADRELSEGGEPSANGEPSADEEPSANKKPSETEEYGSGPSGNPGDSAVLPGAENVPQDVREGGETAP